MAAISSSAPGKIILFGEHAVVYGRPAIAIPVHQRKASVYILADPLAETGRVEIIAPDIDMQTTLRDLPEEHPFSCLLKLVQNHLRLDHLPAMRMKIKSSIPIASGLGSGTAVSVAIIGQSPNVGQKISDAEVSSLTFEIEKLYHGSPSGIDNTVISYTQPIFFIRDQCIETLAVGREYHFLVAHSGIASKTVEVVGSVRAGWEKEHAYYENLFDEIGEISLKAKAALSKGDVSAIGSLMNQNQVLLSQIGVSSPELELLISTAQKAGALGVKLSGAGRGGNIITLVNPETSSAIAQALRGAGAQDVFPTSLPPSPHAEMIWNHG